MLPVVIFAALSVVLMAGILLDVLKIIRLSHPAVMGLGILLAENVPLILWWLEGDVLSPFAKPWRLACLIPICALIFYLWIRANVFPVMDSQPVGMRLKILRGGVYLGRLALWTLFAQAAALWIVYARWGGREIPISLCIVNGVYSLCTLLFLFANAGLRLFFTSRRLSLFPRLLMLLTLWIPLANLVVLGYVCRLAQEEYQMACEREALHRTRAESAVCQTRYPLILVHGVLFRDLKYFNYWGRIPRELIRNGATVFYGGQEAVGTIEDNAQQLRERILEVVAQTGCQKVNLIAHSKGGLDARYAVSQLGMGEYVASLTTLNTPHRGCRFVDKACQLPEGFYRSIARVVNAVFRRLGDRNPDFYTATHQFTTQNSEQFNREVPDVPGVYYQSYMSKMKGGFSDGLLALTYYIIRPLEGENDGLVSLSSAPWGEFQGVLESSRHRGISHGDMIDLKREDYRGFRVLDAYVDMVAALKQKGF